MTEVAWSRSDDEDCIRLHGVVPGADIEVRPRLGIEVGRLPSMAGRWVIDGDDVCFVPRFAFIPGTSYTVTVDGVPAAVLPRRGLDRPATTEVTNIHPTANVVPRNLLRLYVSFSAPMSEGYARAHVRLVDDAGDTMIAARLGGEELWDATRQRLTVLLDPARIKRGLLPHRQAGYPLQAGTSIRVVVDDGFRDASGTPLQAGLERWYRVGADQRGRVDPHHWTVTAPSAGTLEPLDVTFDRPLDHALLSRCLHVLGPDARKLHGRPRIGPEERSWRFTPTEPWLPERHRLAVNPVLEDLAGNSVARVFDRDLTDPADQPNDTQTEVVAFIPH